MSIRLEEALGTSAETWLAMQGAYDLWQAKKNKRTKNIARIAPEIPPGMNLREAAALQFPPPDPRNLIYQVSRRISRVMTEHKIACAVARLNDDAAMRSLLEPIKDAKSVRTVLRMVHTSILCPFYDEEMRIARYIVLDINSHIVGCHFVTEVSRQQAKKITAGCVSVSRWSPAAFDAVVERVLGGTTQHVH